MLRTVRSAILVTLVTSSLLPGDAAAEDVGKWKRFEAVYTNTSYSGNPFHIDFTGTFTHTSSGRTLTQFGFYAGDDTWKIYFMPDRTGEWTFVTSSPDSDLNAKTGSFTCVSSGLPGSLEPYATRRWKLADGEATQPVWIPTREYFRTTDLDAGIRDFIDWADETVGARMIGTTLVYFRQPQAWNVLVSGTLDEYYLPVWDRMNEHYDYLRDRGMGHYIMMYTDDGDAPSANGMAEYSEEEIQLFKYTVARFGAYPIVVWDTAIDVVEHRSEDWVNWFIDWFRDNDPWDHPVGSRTGFNTSGGQTGWIPENPDYYSDGDRHRSEVTRNLIVEKWTGRDVPMAFCDRFREDDSGRGWTRELLREVVWEAGLTGGTGVYFTAVQNAGYLDRDYASDLAVAPDVGVAQRFFRDDVENFGALVPHDELVSGSRAALSAVPGVEYVVYMPSGGTVSVNLSAVSGSVSGTWLNCITGATQSAGTTTGGGSRSFSAPSSGDWTLHLLTGEGGGDGNDPPSPPSNLSAVADGPTSITVSWDAVTDDRTSPGDIRYDVREYAHAGGGVVGSVTGGTGRISFTDIGLDPGTRYTYRIQACDDGVPERCALSSTDASATTDATSSPPNDPSAAVAVSLGPTSVRVSWVDNGDPDGDPVEFYVEEIGDASIASGWLPPGTTSWEATGLQPATEYQFRVRGRDDGDPPLYSGWATTNTVATGEAFNQPPYEPIDVVATVLGDSEVRIDWTATGDPDGDAVQYYVRDVDDAEIASDWLPVGTTSWTATGLEPSTTYRFLVRARDDGDPPAQSGWAGSNEVTTDDPPNRPPNAPIDVTATVIGETAVRVTWIDKGDPDGDPVEFYLEDTTDPGLSSGWLPPGTMDWLASDLTSGTRYEFRIVARDDADPPLQSDWVVSNAVETGVVDNQPPSEPTNVVATALGSTEVEITWSEATDPDGDPIEYFVRDVDDATITSDWLPAGTTSWRATGLEPATTYKFLVRARDDADPPARSGWAGSNFVTTDAPGNRPPAVPGEPTATVLGPTSIRVTWIDLGDPDGDAVEFYVEAVGSPSITSGWLPAGTTRWDATDLTSHTTYTFRVRARDDASPPLESDWATTNEATTADTPNRPPSEPSNVRATVEGQREVLITWDPAVDPDGDPIEYLVREVDDAELTSGWLPASTTSWLVTDLAPFTTYRFLVRARDDADPPAQSGWAGSNEVVTDPGPNQGPTEPRDVVAQATSATTIHITWTGATDPDGDQIEYYVREATDATIQSGWLSGGITSWEATELQPETTYKFLVRARDDGTPPAQSGWAGSAYVTTPPENQTPSAPPVLSALAMGHDVIRLTWEPAVDPNGEELAYRVESVSEPSIASGWLEIGVRTWDATGLSADSAYRFRVQARNERGFESGWLVGDEVRTLPEDVDTTPPLAPEVPAATVGTGGVALSWTPSAEGRIQGYHVYRRPQGGILDRLTPTPIPETRFVDETAETGLAYYYTVTAVSTAGIESAPSLELWVRASVSLPRSIALDRVYPNPFRSEATFRFSIPEVGEGRPEGARVTIDLYDVAGRRVGRVLDDYFQPGVRQVAWSVSDVQGRLSPGIYIAVLRSEGVVSTERLALTR